MQCLETMLRYPWEIPRRGPDIPESSRDAYIFLRIPETMTRYLDSCQSTPAVHNKSGAGAGSWELGASFKMGEW
jgi:hypothetical protein